MARKTEFETKTVSILGTGDFGRAMAIRLVKSGYTVHIGSRNPAKRQLSDRNSKLSSVNVTTIEQAIKASNVIFLALHPQAHKTLETYESYLDGKVLIDVSNPDRMPREGEKSTAERLADMFPKCKVVKAFNTVSAYVIEFEHAGETRTVNVCSDDHDARIIVHQIASDICFHSVDCGRLNNARRLESSSLSLFPGWGWPSFVCLLVFLIWFAYCLVRYYRLRSPPYTWDRIPTNVFNKVFGCMSITLLALAYLPGCFAGFIQLSRGTKHRAFSRSLDRWLKMRKQLGLYALFFGLLHTFMSVVLLSPAYYSKMFHTYNSVVPLNRTSDTVIPHTSRMNWNGETLTLLGFIAIFNMALLGVASLPSVGSTLNWREWTFLQSWMGLICLVLSAAHVTVKAMPDWTTKSFGAIAQGLAFISLLLPYLTILLRLILLLPCLYIPLKKIRAGWERGAVYDVETLPENHVKGEGLSNGQYNPGFVQEQTGL